MKFYETQPANPVDSEDTAESFGRQTDWQYPWQCWVVLVRFGGHTSEPCMTTFQLLTTDKTSGKVFASIVLSRLRDGVEMHLRTEQAGFRPGRSCNDQIFTLRQIIVKVTAWQKPVMINFIDFRKAFDCLHRPSMWSILRQYGIPDTLSLIHI